MLYCCWRFLGSHPAVRWRSHDVRAPSPPGPWPARVDAFMVACAIEAGERESDLAEVIRGFAGASR